LQAADHAPFDGAARSAVRFADDEKSGKERERSGGWACAAGGRDRALGEHESDTERVHDQDAENAAVERNQAIERKIPAIERARWCVDERAKAWEGERERGREREEKRVRASERERGREREKEPKPLEMIRNRWKGSAERGKATRAKRG